MRQKRATAIFRSKSAEGRKLEHELVELVASAFGLVVLSNTEDRAGDHQEDQPPEVADEVREVDDHLGQEGQARAETFEEGREDRDDLPENDVHDDDRDDHDGDRVDERRSNLALELDVLLDVGGEPLQDGVEDTAGLARRDHVDVEVVKGLGVFAAALRRATVHPRRPAGPGG